MVKIIYFFFIISLICLKILVKHIGLNESNNIISNLLSNFLLIKRFFILGTISSIIMIIYYILSLYLFLMFSKENFSIPNYYPKFILNWLKFIHKISKATNKNLFIELYLRLKLVYLFLLVLVLLTLFVLN